MVAIWSSIFGQQHPGIVVSKSRGSRGVNHVCQPVQAVVMDTLETGAI
jgi:hypothetical protein